MAPPDRSGPADGQRRHADGQASDLVGPAATVGAANVDHANIIIRWRCQQVTRLTRMTPAEDATPALLTAKPTWLISQISAHAHRLLTERLATGGARGDHVRPHAGLGALGPGRQ